MKINVPNMAFDLLTRPAAGGGGFGHEPLALELALTLREQREQREAARKRKAAASRPAPKPRAIAHSRPKPRPKAKLVRSTKPKPKPKPKRKLTRAERLEQEVKAKAATELRREFGRAPTSREVELRAIRHMQHRLDELKRELHAYTSRGKAERQMEIAMDRAMGVVTTGHVLRVGNTLQLGASLTPLEAEALKRTGRLEQPAEPDADAVDRAMGLAPSTRHKVTRRGTKLILGG